MSRPRGHNIENYTFHPARRFSLEWAPEDGDCQIFFLSERQTEMLRKMVQVFPHYYWVWGIPGPQKHWDPTQWATWQAIEDFVNETEAALVSGCDAQGMMDAINRLTAAVAGEQITVDGVQHDYTLNGISPLLTRLVEVEGQEVLTLDEILNELDVTDMADVADLVEIFSFLKELIPSFNPTLNLSGLLGTLLDARFKLGVTNLMMDIAISQRAQATAQGGIGFHGLYDAIGATGIVGWIAAQTAKGGPLGWFTGAAKWLWVKLGPAEVAGWTTWVDSISGLLLGSIRGANYDQLAALQEIRDNLVTLNLTQEQQNQLVNAVENILGGSYEPD